MADGLGAESGDQIASGEVLYRCVKPEYKMWDGDAYRPSSQAFGFGNPPKGVSVERAWMCGHDPSHTQVEATDYICSATAEMVRTIKTEQRNHKNKLIETHNTDVKATPEEGTDAHADILEKPKFPHPNLYKKLKAKLALTFTWESGFGP